MFLYKLKQQKYQNKPQYSIIQYKESTINFCIN